MEKMLNIVLFGPPGAGKGTQSENLISKYGLVHLSTGDILRSEIARGTSLGTKAKEIMDRGELVSDEIVIGMIESKLDENTHAKGFIFDGFPRTAAQAVALDDLLQKKGTGISGMLALEVDDEELTKRLLLRGRDSGRPDDRDETVIRRRIQEYNNKTLPLKNYYHEQGKFHSIDGIGTIDEIFKSLVERIVFLNAEMDLTALETDLEHLDLTIQDFEVADDIAPELLLEIDAIKRAEAEEEEEKRAKVKISKQSTVSSKQSAAGSSKAPVKKSSPKKASAKKKVAVKKAVAKKPVKKAGPKKAAKKVAKASKKVTKKPIKKASKKKVTPKKTSPKKVVAKKKVAKKIVKKVVKKLEKKATAKNKKRK
ncbi:adenylate kinase [Aurantibacillus circumpalustris]|uniref:adenylate kinase n=1 Tax=Aurantibacillus circumpalustris TaxID=3036359 RepID=UPI00295A7193|nr:adenylate kinase [Aurantibacillus circumpalustris]